MKMSFKVADNIGIVTIQAMPDIYYLNGGNDHIYTASFVMPKNLKKVKQLIDETCKKLLSQISEKEKQQCH